MGSAQDWYHRKLGQPQPQVPQPQPPQPQYPQAPYQAPQYPPGNYPQVPAPQQPLIPSLTSLSPLGPDQPVTKDNIGQQAAYWQGGEGRDHSSRCPKCGDERYFDRSSIAGGRIVRDNQVITAAPECMACGYNGGMFTQADAANYQGGA